MDKDIVTFIEYLGKNYVLLEGYWLPKNASRFDKSNYKSTEELYDNWQRNNDPDLGTI